MVRGNGLMLGPTWGFDYVFFSPRDEGRLAAVDLLHSQLRRLLVKIAWEPNHPFLATFWLETWRVLSCAWWRSFSL